MLYLYNFFSLICYSYLVLLCYLASFPRNLYFSYHYRMVYLVCLNTCVVLSVMSG